MSAESLKIIKIVDYGLGNLFSVKQALLKVGAFAEITSDPDVVLKADAIVLPGVGAFSQAMQNLKSRGLDQAILQNVKAGGNFFGICLGLQLLFESSSEYGLTPGLGLLKGQVVKFPETSSGQKLRVPQIGWNTIQKPSPKAWQGTPLFDIPENAYMYFVHSYFVVPEDPANILCQTNYQGVNYCSGVLAKNIFATQFHPEKSGERGLQIYKNWLASLNGT